MLSWTSRCEYSRSAPSSSSSYMFRRGGRGKVEEKALTSLVDFGGRGGGRKTGGDSFILRCGASVSEVLSEMFCSSARDLET
jgi:hypothetical protein